MNRGFNLWGWPLLFALLTLVGLVAALLGEGAWDWLSWTSLAPVVLLSAWLGRKI
ncbi:MAG TPA: hypothetical protein VFV28_07935 [Limnobacter sp.]|nr:hypothetical protein [Limnobacter sp.]